MPKTTNVPMVSHDCLPESVKLPQSSLNCIRTLHCQQIDDIGGKGTKSTSNLMGKLAYLSGALQTTGVRLDSWWIWRTSLDSLSARWHLFS